MRREERQPSWLGPAIAALLLLMAAGLVALLWMTVGSEGAQEDEHGAAPARIAVPAARAARSDVGGRGAPAEAEPAVRTDDIAPAPAVLAAATYTRLGPVGKVPVHLPGTPA